jgi:nitroreductase
MNQSPPSRHGASLVGDLPRSAAADAGRVEFNEVIRKRRMVRAFTTAPLDPAVTGQFRAQYGVPERYVPIGAVAVGHPDPAADAVGSSRVIKRRSLDDLVHHGRWRARRRPAGPSWPG